MNTTGQKEQNSEFRFFKYNGLYIEEGYNNELFKTTVLDRLESFREYNQIKIYIEEEFVEEYPHLKQNYLIKAIAFNYMNQIIFDMFLRFRELINELFEEYNINNPDRQIGAGLTHITNIHNLAFKEIKQEIANTFESV